MSPISLLKRLAVTRLPALAVSLSATSPALVLISSYQLLRADGEDSPLPHFMRQRKLPATAAQPTFSPVIQRSGPCPCKPALAGDLMVLKPQMAHRA